MGFRSNMQPIRYRYEVVVLDERGRSERIVCLSSDLEPAYRTAVLEPLEPGQRIVVRSIVRFVGDDMQFYYVRHATPAFIEEICDRPPPEWHCNLPRDHEGSCPTWLDEHEFTENLENHEVRCEKCGLVVGGCTTCVAGIVVEDCDAQPRDIPARTLAVPPKPDPRISPRPGQWGYGE